MNLRDILATSGIYSFVVIFVLGGFVYTQNRKKPINIYFGIFAITVGCWSVGSSLVNMIADEQTALWALRGCYLFAVMLPPAFLRFSHLIASVSRNSGRTWMIGSYSLSAVLLLFLFSDLFIERLRLIEPYHFRISDPGPVYYIFIVFFLLCVAEFYSCCMGHSRIRLE